MALICAIILLTHICANSGVIFLNKDSAIQLIREVLLKVDQKPCCDSHKDYSAFYAGAEFGLSLALVLVKLIDNGDSR